MNEIQRVTDEHEKMLDLLIRIATEDTYGQAESLAWDLLNDLGYLGEDGSVMLEVIEVEGIETAPETAQNARSGELGG